MIKRNIIIAVFMVGILLFMIGCSSNTISSTNSENTFTVRAKTKTTSHPQYGIGDPRGFTIDGTEGKEITLKRGVTYKFDVSSPLHPFYITDEKIGVSRGTKFTTPLTSGTMTFTPDSSHPDTIYYACNLHPNMGWKINIID